MLRRTSTRPRIVPGRAAPLLITTADTKHAHDNTPIAVRAPFLDLPLRARSLMVEGRYKLAPGLYVAGRFDHLGFSDITGTTRTDTWEAPVTRVEVGGGYSLLRNLLLKLSYQYNTRDGGRVETLNLAAAQLLFWF